MQMAVVLMEMLSTARPSYLNKTKIIRCWRSCQFLHIFWFAARIDQVLQKFFPEPLRRWNNNEKKHGSKNKVLWIQNWWKAPWVKARLATITQGRVQSGGGLRSHYGFSRGLDHGALWQKPPCVKARITTMAQDRVQAVLGLRSQYDYRHGLDHGASSRHYNRETGDGSFRIGGDVSKMCQEGRLKEALQIVDLMIQRGIRASINTYACLLQGCVRMKALSEGKRVHAHIIKSGLELNIILGNTLLDMYAKWGNPSDARQVFDTMPEHNVFSWTAVILAYAKQGQDEEAIDLFHRMQQAGMSPDKIVFIIVLKSCASLAAFECGKQVHAQIIKTGFERDVCVGNTLIHMYAKCGSIRDACQVFNNMHKRDVVSWNVMIAGYARRGHHEEALALFKQMQCEGFNPDRVTIVSILKACASPATLEHGKQVHAFIIKQGFESDAFVGSTLVDMYAKCMSIKDARQVFNRMYNRDAVSWNAMIAGYAQQGQGEEALTLFEQMQCAGVQPNRATFLSILKACGSLAALEAGKQVHAKIIICGLESCVFVACALVDMYVKCGSIEDAQQVFKRVHKRDVALWNVMTAGYVQEGHGEKALMLFEQMQQEEMKPNNLTFVSILKACSSLGALGRGKEVHALIIRRGFESDAFVGSALVDMYAKCGSIENARQVFNKMQKRDVVSWTAMIAGYVQQGHGEEALSLFEQMQQAGVKPNKVTFVSILKACTSVESVEQGKQVHAHIIKSDFDLDIFVGSALVDMYAKCGSIKDAHEVFNKMHEQNVVSWTALIAGYVQQGHAEEAFALFETMQQEGLKPNNVTFVTILKACASRAAMERGRQLHDQIIKSGYESDVFVGNSLVDLYAKCGSIEDACQVFNKMSERNVVSWNTLIAGYAQQGLGKEALTLFEQMQREGVKPNEATFVCVLRACSHAGLVDEGHHVFDSMSQYYGVIPTMGHYACMVDLLGRAGLVAEAEDLINKMPVQPDAVVWMALLGACRSCRNLEVGRRAFEGVLNLEPKRSGAYVLLSNIYASACRWDAVAKIRKEMEITDVKKEPGCSWIEVKNKVHVFFVAERAHPQIQEIQAELKKLMAVMEQTGYLPDLTFVLHDMGDELKKEALFDHSEKLAIGFGLISTLPGTPIRIKKNLRVCGDCHNATKIISKVVGREIIAGDANRFHHVWDGVCSCGDYW